MLNLMLKFYFTVKSFLCPFAPVRLAAISPTFCPGGLLLQTVEECPTCW